MRNFTFRTRILSSTGGRWRTGNSTDGAVACEDAAECSSEGIVRVAGEGNVADKSNVAG